MNTHYLMTFILNYGTFMYDYLIRLLYLVRTVKYYNLLALRLGRGGIPARAHSNHEWKSNRIEFSNTNFVALGRGRAW